MTQYERAYDLAVSALAWCSFRTLEEMEAAYKTTALVIEAGMNEQLRAAAEYAYTAVDNHLWDATIAAKVRDDILLGAANP